MGKFAGLTCVRGAEVPVDGCIAEPAQLELVALVLGPVGVDGTAAAVFKLSVCAERVCA